MKAVKASLNIGDSWSDPILLNGGFHFSLDGGWVGTITVERKPQGDGFAWQVVETFTANTQEEGTESEGAFFRFGFDGGDWTSGTAIGRLSQ